MEGDFNDEEYIHRVTKDVVDDHLNSGSIGGDTDKGRKRGLSSDRGVSSGGKGVGIFLDDDDDDGGREGPVKLGAPSQDPYAAFNVLVTQLLKDDLPKKEDKEPVFIGFEWVRFDVVQVMSVWKFLRLVDWRGFVRLVKKLKHDPTAQQKIDFNQFVNSYVLNDRNRCSQLFSASIYYMDRVKRSYYGDRFEESSPLGSQIEKIIKLAGISGDSAREFKDLVFNIASECTLGSIPRSDLRQTKWKNVSS